MNKVSEIIERCKDKTYLNQNKTFLKELFRQRKSIDCLKNELNGKRNYFVLNILERIDYDFHLIIPTLEKKYITQYMYASMFWLYKKAYIDKKQLEKIQENFRVMKNFTKMFEDTENHFLMFRIENDRKLQKIIKEDYNNKTIPNIKILPNFEGEYVFILNVDSLFDLGGYNDYDIDDAKEMISRIKHEFSKFNYTNENDSYNINRIRNKFHYSTMLYNKVDRILNNKFSKIYNNILQVKRKGVDIKLVSECTILQLLSEITFFRYETISYEDIYSVKDKQEEYTKIFIKNKGKRIVIFGEKDKIEYEDKVYYIDIKYLNIFNKIILE
ncbi:hypothetical protein NCER_101693 [Vairimorpha ceranae BRL01]|uniref:Uncharacterized protein n=2 Tax=Vairimorpha ceranae TaxID=40302 RepID=C4VAK4_VAIC1|nr:hypothetical protein AAJ76_6500011323 [Vairimorpha ceranae]EEQ81744.1 hypothetical protein NCER_101693 [Vairimorpha ceranae BRL01]KAF5141790.1 hypothetical protein G9O61_00g000730 [Vairimorpha ceranae]KKO74500.1 hypothetical protein AAJ76_6500011323 [Vairimorpha ceranae]